MKKNEKASVETTNNTDEEKNKEPKLFFQPYEPWEIGVRLSEGFVPDHRNYDPQKKKSLAKLKKLLF